MISCKITLDRYTLSGNKLGSFYYIRFSSFLVFSIFSILSKPVNIFGVHHQALEKVIYFCVWYIPIGTQMYFCTYFILNWKKILLKQILIPTLKNILNILSYHKLFCGTPIFYLSISTSADFKLLRYLRVDIFHVWGLG